MFYSSQLRIFRYTECNNESESKYMWALHMQENNIVGAHLEKHHRLVDQTALKYSEMSVLVVNINQIQHVSDKF